jgi:photosystem II stability/assembly factor-like uncharacterized protein
MIARLLYLLVVLYSLYGVSSVAQQIQWQQTNGPFGGDIHCFCRHENTLFCGTNNGIYLSNDNGSSWSLCGLEQLSVFALCQSGTIIVAGVHSKRYNDATTGIYRSSNNGATWKHIIYTGSSPDININALVASNSILYAGSDTKGLYRSTNDGLNWENTRSLPINALIAKANELYFSSDDSGVFRSTDNGDTWNRDFYQWYAQPLTADSITVLVGQEYSKDYYSGGINRSDNGGPWYEINPELFGKQNITAVAIKGELLLAATDTNGIYRSTDDGLSWNRLGLKQVFINSIYFDGDTILLGTGSGIYKSTDWGDSWNSAIVGIIATSITAIATNEQFVFAATEHQGIFRSSDNGNSWKEINNTIPLVPISALVAKGTTIMAAFGANGVYSSNDEGNSWNKSLDTTITILANNSTTFWAANDYVLYRSTDSGAHWIRGDKDGIFSNNKPIGSVLATDEMVFAGGRNLYLSFDKGDHWLQSTYEYYNEWIASLVISDNILYALWGSDILRSLTKGYTWEKVGGEGFNDFFSNLKVTSIAASGTTVIASAVGSDSGIFISNDTGATWGKSSVGLRHKNITVITPANNIFYCGTENGGVYKSSAPTRVTHEVSRNQDRVDISPNPVDNKLFIHYFMHTKPVSISLFNILGTRVFQQLLNSQTESQAFDVEDLQSGSYLLTLETGNEILTKKILIAR